MLSKNDKMVFDQFVSKLRRKYPDAKIWAFGSRTRGDCDADSDLDVCVVIDELDDASDSEIMGIAWEVGFENDTILSTVTFSRQEFEKGPCSVSGLVKNILNEGIAA